MEKKKQKNNTHLVQQFSSILDLHTQDSPHAIYPVSLSSPVLHLNSSNVGLTDNSSILSFEIKSLTGIFLIPLSPGKLMICCPCLLVVSKAQETTTYLRLWVQQSMWPLPQCWWQWQCRCQYPLGQHRTPAGGAAHPPQRPCSDPRPEVSAHWRSTSAQG